MKKHLLLALAVVAMVSCEEKPKAYNGEVKIASDISTRASGTTWDKGDEIGVFMISGDTELNSNVPYSNNKSNGAIAEFASEDPIYYPQTGAVDFMAYYPQDDDVTSTSYNVDVRDQEEQSEIDLMTAYTMNQEKSPAPVEMQFAHKLSNIIVTIEAGEGISDSELDGITIQLIGTKAKASYDLTNDEIDFANAVAQDITLKTDANGKSAYGIVIPQALNSAKIVMTSTINNLSFTSELSTPAFAAGEQYEYTATITNDNKRMVVTLSGATIKPWIGDSDGSDNTLIDIEGNVTGLMFESPEITIERYSSQALMLKVTPVDAVNMDDIVFTTSVDEVAYVSADGLLLLADTLGGLGTTTITATIGNISTSMTVNVKTFHEIVEVETWFGFWDMGGLRVNPEYNPNLTYDEAMANSALGEAYDSTKTFRQYCDSIGYSKIYILCNGVKYVDDVDGSGFVGGSSFPVFELYVSYLYRNSTAAYPHEAIYIMLNNVNGPNPDDAYTVDPNWTGENAMNPNVNSSAIMAGYCDEELLKAFYQGVPDVDRYSIFRGSIMNHSNNGYWYLPNAAIVTEANVQIGHDGNGTSILGNCYLKVEHPVAMGTIDDVIFEHKIYEYNIGKDAQKTSAPRSYGSNLIRHSAVAKSLNLAVISKLALTNPSLLR